MVQVNKDLANTSRRETTRLQDVHQNIGEVTITTRDCVHGRVIEREIGMVVASAVRSKSIVSDVFAALGGIFGGEVSSYTDLLSECSEEATRRLTKMGEELGASSIVRVKFQTTTTMNRLVVGLHTSVLVFGTAVIDRPARVPM